LICTLSVSRGTVYYSSPTSTTARRCQY
jgi:hypothetical protein